MRLGGARPLDEAVASDATYRFASYAAADQASKENLMEAFKTTVMAGDMPTQSQVESFAHQYAALGGKQSSFNKWMITQMKTANTSQANLIAQHLKSPYSQSMQRVMGGSSIMDGMDAMNPQTPQSSP